MRTLLGFLAAAAIVVAVILHQKKPETAAPPQHAAAAAPAPVTRPTSEHNWPKSALDRAADVKRQVAEQRKQDETN